MNTWKRENNFGGTDNGTPEKFLFIDRDRDWNSTGILWPDVYRSSEQNNRLVRLSESAKRKYFWR